jgi:hypothetical protein
MNIENNYDLSLLDNTNTNTNTKSKFVNITKKKCVYNKETYNVIKYIKKNLTHDNCTDVGKYRSVIMKNNEIKSFSLPKSVNFKIFTDSFKLQNVIVEDFVEGTMINVFWDNDKWEISTKSNVGGNVSFFSSIPPEINKTFRVMFKEAIQYHDSNLDIQTFLPDNSDFKNMCFSFVLQHPSNRIVVPFDKPNIFLVAIHVIDEFKVMRLDITDYIKSSIPSFIKYTRNYIFNNYKEIVDTYSECSYSTVGIMLTDINTHQRTKIRNSDYEHVKLLRGNQPKLLYRYLMLRQSQDIDEYLEYYPEQKLQFDIFKHKIQMFTTELYNEYRNCFIFKIQSFKESAYHLKPHISNMHNIYKINNNNNHNVKFKITFNVTQTYVDNLHPSKLMYSMNYPSYNK